MSKKESEMIDDVFEYEKLCIHDLIGFADVAMKISETKMFDHPDPEEEKRIERAQKAASLVKHTPELIEALFLAHEQATETLTHTASALSKVGIDLQSSHESERETHDQ